MIAWLWARTVRSPDPAAKGAMVPLVSSFMLSTKEGKKAWVEPVIDPARPTAGASRYIGALSKADEERLKKGTKTGRANFRCLLTGASIGGAYADQEAQAGRMSATHTMLAMYHLANSADLERLEGVLEIAKAAGVTSWRKANVAVFTGSSKGPDVSLNLDKGPKVHTLWGYIAWRMAGERGLKSGRGGGSRAHEPRLGADGRSSQARRAERDLARRLVAYARQFRTTASKHSCRSSSR